MKSILVLEGVRAEPPLGPDSSYQGGSASCYRGCNSLSDPPKVSLLSAAASRGSAAGRGRAALRHAAVTVLAEHQQPPGATAGRFVFSLPSTLGLSFLVFRGWGVGASAGRRGR